MLFAMCQKTSSALVRPNGMILYSKCPYLVRNVVFHSSPGRIRTRLYAPRKSIFVKNLAPLIRSKRLEISGSAYLSFFWTKKIKLFQICSLAQVYKINLLKFIQIKFYDYNSYFDLFTSIPLSGTVVVGARAKACRDKYKPCVWMFQYYARRTSQVQRERETCYLALMESFRLLYIEEDYYNYALSHNVRVHFIYLSPKMCACSHLDTVVHRTKV